MCRSGVLAALKGGAAARAPASDQAASALKRPSCSMASPTSAMPAAARSYPASTTHSQRTPDEPRAAGVTDGSVRLAVGLANIDEIRTDLDRALAAGGG